MKALPQLPLRFLKWFCRPEYHLDIEGDLLEMYDRRADETTEKQASRRLCETFYDYFAPA